MDVLLFVIPMLASFEGVSGHESYILRPSTGNVVTRLGRSSLGTSSVGQDRCIPFFLGLMLHLSVETWPPISYIWIPIGLVEAIDEIDHVGD